MRKLLASFVALSLLAGCSSGVGSGLGGIGTYYRLIKPQPRTVARGTMIVQPTIAWNQIPRGPYDISREENWTLNGPYLDGLSFIGGLGNNERIVYQRRKADRKVPNFYSNMTPQDIADMIESFYMIRAGSVRFDVTALQPRAFLGQSGFQFDYNHLGGDEVERQGRAVGAIINGRLYLALFDATKLHYYGAGIGEFERIVQSARLRR
ncbi:MAG TPA: hypothetical protein VGD10_00900 [Allosphingosinicella sp.]|uniref:hypothetical protein n=1 Tax=Allosphingosinicella sp. TaxID=2823234 RepID=UPI002ED9EE42